MVWWWYITLWMVAQMGGQPVTLLGTNDDSFPMMQGLYQGKVVHYVPFACSDLLTARRLDKAAKHIQDVQNCWWTPVDYSPALACTLDKDVFGQVYFINGGQTAIFSSDPTDADNYTPLWSVHNLEWVRGAVKQPLKSEADVVQALADQLLVEISDPAVLDATIVIDSTGKATAQALRIDMRARKIWLPVLWTYHKGKCRLIAVTETSDEELAKRLGARWCKRLANAATDPPCCDTTYAFVNPSPWMQLPVIEDSQVYKGNDCFQSNPAYTPLRCWNLLDRVDPDLKMLFKSTETIRLRSGSLVDVPTTGPIVTNSPIVHPEWWEER